MTKRPSPSVEAWRWTAVLRFKTVISTEGTTAPRSSITVPASVAAGDCARAAAASSRSAANRRRQTAGAGGRQKPDASACLLPSAPASFISVSLWLTFNLKSPSSRRPSEAVSEADAALEVVRRRRRHAVDGREQRPRRRELLQNGYVVRARAQHGVAGVEAYDGVPGRVEFDDAAHVEGEVSPHDRLEAPERRREDEDAASVGRELEVAVFEADEAGPRLCEDAEVFGAPTDLHAEQALKLSPARELRVVERALAREEVELGLGGEVAVEVVADAPAEARLRPALVCALDEGRRVGLAVRDVEGGELSARLPAARVVLRARAPRPADENPQREKVCGEVSPAHECFLLIYVPQA